MRKLLGSRHLLGAGVSLVTLLACSSAALAQDAPAGDGEDRASEVIVVTGSRVQRDGYDAPTPATILDVAAIEKAAPANIADFVNQLPQLNPSATPRVGNGATSTGTAGLNLLDLRGLGANRSLVLVDGQRVAPSTQTGAVDINNIPSALLQRVDVVTGGASAAYGSDAVAGVVNFVINENFEGLKLNLVGGITDRSDNENWQASAAFGTGFAGGRGRLLLSVEHQYEAGIHETDPEKRDWFNYIYLVPNPAYTTTNGQPRQIISPNVYYNSVALGGMITSGPLRGTAFGPNGVPYAFNYGTSTVNSSSPTSFFMIGGTPYNEGNVASIAAQLNRNNVWGRVAYDVTDSITATVDASYGRTRSFNYAALQRYTGGAAPLNAISINNPFLPRSVRDAGLAANVSTFAMGHSTADFGRMENHITRENMRFVGTLSGTVFDNWNWEAYYQYGRSDIRVELQNTTNIARFRDAVDAVLDPNTGRIVCRTTLTAPNNGCVPVNLFGEGVASPESIAWFKGTAFQDQVLTEQVLAASANGELGATWAGPISLAFGLEHRRERAEAVGDPISVTNGFVTGNFKTNSGGYNVTDAFLETVVPLLDNSLGTAEFNGAVRLTDYSLSGNVVTWKAGLTYQPIDDLRIRLVRSRDIRSPSIAEGFAAGSTQAVDVVVPNQAPNTYTPGTFRITQVTNGNPALTPEKADTLSVGAVLTPTFLPGFSASVDYYDISIGDAITSLAVNDIVALCYAGQADICSFITADANRNITQITRVPVNVASLNLRGIDFDASYRRPIGIGDGDITLRVLATKTFEYSLNDGRRTTEYAGVNGGPQATFSIPKWRTYTTLGYENDRLSLTGTMRTISAGVYSNAWVSGVDIDDNRIDGATYFDLAGSYRLTGDEESYVEAYFKVDNLLDRDPPVAASNVSSGAQTNPILYDVIGRAYRLGVRLRY
jgi:iron complex outermembrane receptor protein